MLVALMPITSTLIAATTTTPIVTSTRSGKRGMASVAGTGCERVDRWKAVNIDFSRGSVAWRTFSIWSRITC